jgi:predicted nucleic acid-binding protein
MKFIFLDTSYLQALANPGDDLHQRAIEVTEKLGAFVPVTSEMVLTELLNALSSKGRYLRQIALEITTKLQNDSQVEIVLQTSELFKSAVEFYSQRLDKGYSLTDCASMLIMCQKGIQDILTYDKHFLQEGFNALLRE